MRYVYHYHATQQDELKISQIDGIVTCDMPVDSMDRYNDVKQSIIRDLCLNSYYALAITSLSLIHVLDDE